MAYINENSSLCKLCKGEFDLYQGKCVPYAFYATYKIDYFNEKIQLFNPSKCDDIYFMKIDKDIINPIYEYNFDNIEINRVYYYLNENISNSLSNIFENIDKITDFSFNNKYINDFIIIDIKGMFKGCTCLTSVSFNSFKGKNVTNISDLFSNCKSLLSVDLSSFEPVYLEDMSSLLYNCSSLIYIFILNFLI